MKFVLVGVLVATFALVCTAQDDAPAVASTTVDPLDKVVASNNYILPVLAARIAKANLPVELQPEADAALADAAQQLQGCEDALRLTHIVWQYKLCSVVVLRTAVNRVKALEDLAAAATSTAAATVEA